MSWRNHGLNSKRSALLWIVYLRKFCNVILRTPYVRIPSFFALIYISCDSFVHLIGAKVRYTVSLTAPRIVLLLLKWRVRPKDSFNVCLVRIALIRGVITFNMTRLPLTHSLYSRLRGCVSLLIHCGLIRIYLCLFRLNISPNLSVTSLIDIIWS